MLGKLFKHELKETGKLLLPLNLIIVVYTFIGAIMLGSRLFENDYMTMMGVASLLLYILSIFAIFIVTFVFFAVRFYKTMYSNQGYLTHTLPVSTGSIIHTKVLVSSFWVLVTMIITVVSIFTMVAVPLGKHIPELYEEFYVEFSFIELVPIIILAVLGCLERVLVMYVSLSIGQLFNQYRVLAAIVTYVVINIATNIMETVTVFVVDFAAIDILEKASESVSTSYYFHSLLSFTTIENLILCIVFYLVCYFLTTKKLNLE